MPATFAPNRRAASAWLLSPLLTAMPLATRAAAAPADADGALLKAVIAGPHRSAANRARDAYRHPFETLRFFGLQPGQTVIEIAPGAGWYTEILAPYLRDHGHYWAAHNSATMGSEGARKARARFEAKLAAEPAVYGHAKVGTLPTGSGGFTDIHPPGGADLVLTFRNIHNWIEAGQLDEMLRAFHAALKPGGVLGVEEHRAASGTPLAKVIATGYVPVDFITARARAAGFEPAGASEINANPRDTHEHPNGVWSLPPTLQGGEAGKAEFLAIGESDRMTLKFIKPGRS